MSDLPLPIGQRVTVTASSGLKFNGTIIKKREQSEQPPVHAACPTHGVMTKQGLFPARHRVPGCATCNEVLPPLASTYFVHLDGMQPANASNGYSPEAVEPEHITEEY